MNLTTLTGLDGLGSLEAGGGVEAGVSTRTIEDFSGAETVGKDWFRDWLIEDNIFVTSAEISIFERSPSFSTTSKGFIVGGDSKLPNRVVL